MGRRISHEEAMEIGRNLPADVFISHATGKPMISRAEWERLPRWRRIRDVVLFRQPRRGDGWSSS